MTFGLLNKNCNIMPSNNSLTYKMEIKSSKVELIPENWIKDYGDYLYNYAFVRLNDKDAAIDLVQDTFVAALKAMGAFEGRSSEKTWLFSILKRKIIDHYRKAGRNKELKLVDKNFSNSENSDLPFYGDENVMQGSWKADRVPQDWKMSPDSAVENEELSEILKQCISSLPEKWESVFTLKLIDELSTDQICKEMDITSSNLWVILHRAKLQLRECVSTKWVF